MISTYEKMDRMYRIQRHIYDFTRKYYLLGRDVMLAGIIADNAKKILEIGCGTGRNLIILSRKLPNAQLFGIDASSAMIKTAVSKTRAANIEKIKFACALADDFSYSATFNEPTPFDTIFFSYSLSMIPDWQSALKNALDNLAGNGTLYIVDFYDFAALPDFFSRLLKRWLSIFDVSYREGMDSNLLSLNDNFIRVEIQPLYNRYCFIAKVKKCLNS